MRWKRFVDENHSLVTGMTLCSYSREGEKEQVKYCELKKKRDLASCGAIGGQFGQNITTRELFYSLWDFIVAEGSCQSYLAKLFHVIANILRIPTVIINEQYQQFCPCED